MHGVEVVYDEAGCMAVVLLRCCCLDAAHQAADVSATGYTVERLRCTITAAAS
jgi:hypothetical protein